MQMFALYYKLFLYRAHESNEKTITNLACHGQRRASRRWVGAQGPAQSSVAFLNSHVT